MRPILIDRLEQILDFGLCCFSELTYLIFQKIEKFLLPKTSFWIQKLQCMDKKNVKNFVIFLENNICCIQNDISIKMLHSSTSFCWGSYNQHRINKYVSIAIYAYFLHLRNFEICVPDTKIRDISHVIVMDHDESS